MAKLTAVIPPQAFEIIRNRISDILIDELENQYILSYDPDIDNFELRLESSSPVDKVEAPIIIVNFSSGDFNNKNQGSADGIFVFNIDAYTSAKSDQEEDGDSKATFKLQKILGMCYAILSDPNYKTLGFAAPFIIQNSCGQINIADPGKQDAANVMMGRLTLNIKAVQTNPLIIPSLLEGYDTRIKMGVGNSGYKYTGETYI